MLYDPRRDRGSIRASRADRPLLYRARMLNGPVERRAGARLIPRSTWLRWSGSNALQADGRTLSEIARLLGGTSHDEPADVPPTAWWQHAIADDVIVWVRADVSPWRGKQIRRALHEFVAASGRRKERESEMSDHTASVLRLSQQPPETALRLAMQRLWLPVQVLPAGAASWSSTYSGRRKTGRWK